MSHLFACSPCRPLTSWPKSLAVVLMGFSFLAGATLPLLAAPPDPPAPPQAPNPPPAPLLPPVTAPLPPPVTAPGKLGDKPRLEHMVKVSDNRYRIGKIELDQSTRSITFPAAINMDKGMLEYALVTETGKVHEALLSTKVTPFDLNVAMLLLRYKHATNFFPPEFLPPDRQPKPGEGPLVPDATNAFDIKLTWKDKDGKSRTVFLEDWVRNEARKKPAKRAPWIYTGSEVSLQGHFAAQESGSIIALFQDTLAMVNNPRAGSESDEIWLVGDNVPAIETKVQVTLYPHDNGKKKGGVEKPSNGE